MNKKSCGCIDSTRETQGVKDIAANLSNLATKDQKEKPKQNGRFIVAMIPAKKKPLPDLPAEKLLPS